jgi:hypothetical protein
MNSHGYDFPTKVLMFSKEFSVKYCDKPEEVDSDGESLLRGQVDFDNSEIRIFKGDKTNAAEVWHVIIHEVMHIIKVNTALKFSEETEDEEDDVIDCLAMGIAHFLVENNLLAKKRIRKVKDRA